MQSGFFVKLLKLNFCLFLLFMCCSQSSAQALLPDISVIHKQNENLLSWTSGYTGIVQIGVQRSQDSIYNYATIGYVSNPAKKINTYTDRKPLPGKNFYRLFVRLSNGEYFFSNPAKSVIDSSAVAGAGTTSNNLQLPSFIPSIYVYTNAEGNVNISLANAKRNNYFINFYDADDNRIFTIRDINEPFLVLDKSNFLHSGWFHFELFENGKLKERWRFFIPEKTGSNNSQSY